MHNGFKALVVGYMMVGVTTLGMIYGVLWDIRELLEAGAR